MADRPLMLETRTVETTLELREADSTAPVLEGYAATFGQPYELGSFWEQIDPAAFNRTLGSMPDVRLLIDHKGEPIGRTDRPDKPGNMNLSADSKGLHVRAVLDPDDPDVQRIMPKMRRGFLDEMSFGFRVPKGGDTWDNDLRTLRNVELNGGDVSVVTYPANPNTAVALRSRCARSAQFAYVQHILDEIRSEQTVTDEDMARFRSALADVTPDEVTAATVEQVAEELATPTGARALRSAQALATALSL